MDSHFGKLLYLNKQMIYFHRLNIIQNVKKQVVSVIFLSPRLILEKYNLVPFL